MGLGRKVLLGLIILTAMSCERYYITQDVRWEELAPKLGYVEIRGDEYLNFSYFETFVLTTELHDRKSAFSKFSEVYVDSENVDSIICAEYEKMHSFKLKLEAMNNVKCKR